MQFRMPNLLCVSLRLAAISCVVLFAQSLARGQAIFSSEIAIDGATFQPVDPGSVLPIVTAIGDSFGNRLPNNTSELLRMPQIAKELGLDDDQKAIIGDLRKSLRKQVSEVIRSVEFGSDNASNLMREAQKKLREKADEKLEEVLLPEQLSRLKQIKVQSALRSRGALALLTGSLGDEIRLTDKQQNLLKQVNAEKQAELKAKIASLKEEYLEATLEKVLDDKQLSKLKSMSGSKYEVQQRDFGNILRNFAPPSQKTGDKPAAELSKD